MAKYIIKPSLFIRRREEDKRKQEEIKRLQRSEDEQQFDNTAEKLLPNWNSKRLK